MSEQKSSTILAIDPPSSSSSRTSKNTSPTRSIRKLSAVEQEGSRNLDSNTSPTRHANGTAPLPSAAAVQRALSVAKAGSINNDSSSEATRDRRHRSGQNLPHWPTSPRLKSPPPNSAFRSITGRMNESSQPISNGTAKKSTTSLSGETSVSTQGQQESSKDSTPGQLVIRPPGRGIGAQTSALETVNENSVPSTPSILPIPDAKDKEKEKEKEMTKLPHALPEQTLDDIGESFPSKDTKEVSKNGTTEVNTKSGLDKVDTPSSSRATSTSRPATNLAKRSLPSLTGKNKSVVEPLRTMTLETETVSSTPQIITDRGRDGGSVRAKPSTETIRPKKEKKKPSRKAPSLHAGMNSSKADIFEAKVATAVGEADSSDSDETFVYESNPPEVRQVRHHSRTPSANSVASQVDHGARLKHGVRSNSSAIGGKKSMKFSNSIYGNQLDPESAGDGRSSTRTTTNTPRYHHIGRHGRNGHASIIDADSTFTQTNRGTSPRTPTMRDSRPSSPRTSNGRLHFARKSAPGGFDTYDEGADDERAPLIGSVKVNRTRHSRRPNSSHLRALHFEEDEDPGCWPRYRGCILIGIVITLAFLAVSGFLVVVNRSLESVKILKIQNVLASEQTLMLDLSVQAINPNIFTITVSDLDVNIFAESPYVGTTAEWKGKSNSRRLSFTERRQQPAVTGHKSFSWIPPFWNDGDGDEDEDDPINDGPEAQKMLLGRIFEFDSALAFDPSPIGYDVVKSVGEIRLTKPGNKTEAGGSERWNRVLEHPFNLIVRGVLKYQLPLSSSIITAKVGSRISVTPNNSSSDGDDNSTSTAYFSL